MVSMCHHWTEEGEALWEREMDDVTEEDPEGEEPQPEPVTPVADDD